MLEPRLYLTAAPTITGFSTDTGVVGDRITIDNTLTVVGTADAGNTVRVYFNSVLQGNTTAGADGAWAFDAAAKADGIYSITARAVDAGGKVSAPSGAFAVTIDATGPAAPTITGFSSDTGVVGDHTTSDTTLTVTGSAEAASTVTVYFDGTSQGTTTAAANGTWSLAIAEKPEGTYQITASAGDAAGNTSGLSSAYPVTIDTTAPAAPTITSFSVDSGVIGDSITNDNTPTILGTAEPLSSVTVFFNGTSQGTAAVDANGTWTFTSAQLDGTYDVTATAQDAAGNTGPSSGPLTLTIDTVAPDAPIITGFSTDSGVIGDRITNDTTLTIFGTAEPDSRVALFFNGANQGSTTADNAGNWSFDLAEKPEGVHDITATAQDVAGNTSAPSDTLTVTIDSGPPAAPVITNFSTDTGMLGDRITSDNTLTVMGTAEPASVVSLFFNGVFQGTTVAAGNSTWTFDALPQADGVYSITATARDATGNTSDPSGALVVTIDQTAPNTPIITGYSTDTGTPGDGITGDPTLTITGTAEPNCTVTVSFNSTPAGTTTADPSGNWTLSAASKPDGVYSITARCSDTAGNTSGPSSPIVVTIDSTAPGAPTITGYSSDSGAVGDGITSDNTLTVTGTAEPGSLVSVLFNGAPQGSVVAAADSTWSLNAAQKPDGVYTITATASDVAGNVSPASNSLVVTIDTAAPAAPIITGYSTDSGTPGDGITSDPTLAMTGTAEPNCTVTVSFNGTPAGTTTADPSGNWTLSAASKPDGVYTITSRCTDVAGNSSGPSSPLVVTIDSTAPGAPTITGFSSDSGVAGDGITNDNTLTVFGTAEPLSVVTVFFNGTVQGTTTAAAGGAWTLNAPQKADGVYAITATAADVAGNTSPASGPRNVTIDTVAPPIPFVTVTAGQIHQGASEPGTTVTAYVNGVPRGTTTAANDGGWSINLIGVSTTDTVTFDAQDAAANRSPETVPAFDSGGSCGEQEGSSTSPSVDTDFDPITGKGKANQLLMVRERAYEVTPDLRIYGALGKHTYVQSLMFHTRDDENDTEATAATVTFAPGTVILTTITSAKLLGGAKHDSRATASDALFGIFKPGARSADWNKYSGKPRGLESGNNRFDVINDGRNGEPAVLEIDFPTRVGPDQGRVIVDYGDCWSTNLTVSIQFHASRASRGYVPYQGLITPSQDYGTAAHPVVPLYANATTINQITEDNGSSPTDHVTSDDTPLVSGQAKSGASVRLTLNGQLVDKVLADGAGRWSYLFSNLEPGNYRLRAEADFGGSPAGTSPLFSFVITTLPNAV